MPWHQEPKKDVTSCDKLWLGANIHRPTDFRMGKPNSINLLLTYGKYIAIRREPAELKHLSRRRKSNQTRFSQQRRAKGKEGQTRSSNTFGVEDTVIDDRVSGTEWEVRPQGVIVSYTKTQQQRVYPEYCRTRGIRWEAGGTTLQPKILLDDRQWSSTVRER